VPGSNVITLTAFDPVTRRDSLPQSRTITVVTARASPTPSIAVTISQPAADATVPSPVPISGQAAPRAVLEVLATLVSAAELSFRVVDSAGQPVTLRPPPPAAPDPMSVTAGDDGAFSAQLPLAPGTWELRVSADGAEAATQRVSVPAPAGLVGSLAVVGGASYIELEQDGEPVDGVSGGISADGARIPLRATSDLRIRVGNASAVRLALNGVALGPLGAPGAVVEWRITRSGG
jgi:Domain of unknown function (DUF4115)